MRFILRTIAAAAISLIVKEVLTRDAETSENDIPTSPPSRKVK